MERKGEKSILNIENQIYGDFGRYYDFLGWNRFSHICAERLKHFVKLRGNGSETVLDLACGTGELEHRLKKSRLKFTGVDISRQMLAQARPKRPDVRFVLGDMTNTRLNRSFDIVVCYFDSVNHLGGITALRKMFKTAKIHLKPGGFFLFDMLTPEGLEKWDSVDIRRGSDYYVSINGHFDPDKVKASVTIEGFVMAKGKTYQRFNQKITERSYSLDKVAESLTIAGFDDISVTSFDLTEPIEHTSRWYFVVS